jgi:hypothetical protein
MPSEEDAEAMVESAEIFLELTKKYLREIGYTLCSLAFVLLRTIPIFL